MIPQREAVGFIQERAPFKGSNFYGERIGDNYAVFSYGGHWPLAVYSNEPRELLDGPGWTRNLQRYCQPTTRQHASIVDRAVGSDDVHWSSTIHLMDVIATWRLRERQPISTPVVQHHSPPTAPARPVTSKQQDLFDVIT